MRNRPLHPSIAYFSLWLFCFERKKKRRSPKIDLGLACQWLLKPFFSFFSAHSSHASSLAGGDERAGGKTELVTDKMMRGVEVSLLCVRRKDCGKLRPDHPWSLTLFRGKRNGDVRASRRYKGFTGNPSRSRKASFWSGFILTGR